MDLAYDIIKKKDLEKNHEKNMSINNKLDSIFLKFRKLDLLNLSNKLSFSNYINKINTYDFINTSNALVVHFFDNPSADLGYSLLEAYYISKHGANVIKDLDDNINMKIILAANKVVTCLEKLKKSGKIDDKFYEIVDDYYSVYKIWKSLDKFRLIEEMHNEFINNVQIYNNIVNKIDHKNTTAKIENRIIVLLEKIVTINSNYGIKKILENYKILENLMMIRNRVWFYIYNKLMHNDMQIIVILIVEIKTKLINKSDIESRRELYYKIDTDNIVNCIRSNSLTPIVINKILQLLCEKASRITSEKFDNIVMDDTWSHRYNKQLIYCFKKLYNSINYDKIK